MAPYDLQSWRVLESDTSWVFPRIGVPQHGWFIMDNLIKMDDLGVPLFLETPSCVRLTNYPSLLM